MRWRQSTAIAAFGLVAACSSSIPQRQLSVAPQAVVDRVASVVPWRAIPVTPEFVPAPQLFVSTGGPGPDHPSPTPSPPAPGTDWGQLRPSIALPAHVGPGGVAQVLVTLANPSEQPISLHPCPAYAVLVSGAFGTPGTTTAGSGASAEEYGLNCAQAPAAVPALGAVTFAISLAQTLNPFAPWRQGSLFTITWAMASAPHAVATIKVGHAPPIRRCASVPLSTSASAHTRVVDLRTAVLARLHRDGTPPDVMAYLPNTKVLAVIVADNACTNRTVVPESPLRALRLIHVRKATDNGTLVAVYGHLRKQVDVLLVEQRLPCPPTTPCAGPQVYARLVVHSAAP